MDLKYGIKVAPWDQEAYTMEELRKIIDGFKYATQAAVNTIILWCEIGQLGDIRALLESQDVGYQNVQTFFWYKPDMNVVGPVFKRTPAVEVCLIGHRGPSSGYATQFSLSKNPVERQNMIMGPSKRVLSKNARGKAINIHEKPDWLAESILAQYTKPGQWIVVGGFGAGGEVRGALNAGLNVVAIENDPEQFSATVSNMRSFVPSSNLGMVHTQAHLVFGYTHMAFHEEEEEKVDPPAILPPMVLCKSCNNNFAEETAFCSGCGDGGCPGCFSGSPVLCVPCQAVPKTPEEVVLSPASPVNSQENADGASQKVD